MKAFPVSLSPEGVSIRDYSDGDPHTDRQVGALSPQSLLSFCGCHLFGGGGVRGAGGRGGAAKKGPDSSALKD